MSLTFSDEPVLITGFALSGNGHLAKLLSYLNVFLPTPDAGPWPFGHTVNVAICPPYDDPVALRDWRQNPRGEPVDKLKVTQALVADGYRGGIWSFQDPLLCLSAAAWCEAYPNARILMLHRDPLQIMASLHLRLSNADPATHPDKPQLTAWSQLLEAYLRQIRAFSLLPHLMLEIRFEDLIANPFRTLKLVAGFAGIAADDTVILDALAACRPNHERLRRTRPVLENWRTNKLLADPGFRALHAIRAELGYA